MNIAPDEAIIIDLQIFIKDVLNNVKKTAQLVKRCIPNNNEC